MIFFNAHINQKYLSGQIDNQLDSIFVNEDTEINKIAFKFKRKGESEIEVNSQRIELKVPLAMKIAKRDGLFTAEARGEIMITLWVDFDINKDLRGSAKTSIKEYRWISKPVLEIGVFDLPIEKLTDMALKYYDAIITGTIDSKIKPMLNLESIIDDRLALAIKSANANLPLGLKLAADVKMVMMEHPITKDGILQIKGGVTPNVTLSDFSHVLDSSKQFRWVEKIEPTSVDYLDLEISYLEIEKLIKNQIANQEFGGKKIEVTKVNLSYDGLNLRLNAHVKAPIEAEITCIGIPKYNEHEGNLYLKDMDVKINATSLIYKLTAPLLSSYFENQLEDIFPLQTINLIGVKLLNSIPKSFGNESKNGTITVKKIKLASFTPIADRLVGTLQVEDAVIDINIIN